MAQGGSSIKVANSLVSASCAAVLAVYIAGYARTQSAANRIASQIAERRRAAAPVPARPGYPRVEIQLPTGTAGGVPSFRVTIPGDSTRDGMGKSDPIAFVDPHPATANVPGAAAEVPPAESRSTQIAALDPPVSAPVASRATEPAASVPEHKVDATVVAPPAPMWKDGTYTGWGYSRHGNIEASVVVEGGRIASAGISQCRTRYSCSVIDRLPPQVAERQSPEVDFVSGATQSADAFYGAVVAALSKAK